MLSSIENRHCQRHYQKRSASSQSSSNREDEVGGVGIIQSRYRRRSRHHSSTAVVWGVVMTFVVLSSSSSLPTSLYSPPLLVAGWTSSFNRGRNTRSNGVYLLPRVVGDNNRNDSINNTRHKPRRTIVGQRTIQFLSQTLLTNRRNRADSSTSKISTNSNSSDDFDNSVEVKLLKTENALLRDTIRELQLEKQHLLKQQQSAPKRIVLETFEGERYFRGDNDATGATSNANMKEIGSASSASGIAAVSKSDVNDKQFQVQESDTATATLIKKSAVDFDVNKNDNELWCDDVLDDGTCPIEPTISFGEALRDRAYWLVGLLIMQSLSGIILASNEALLSNHPEIVYYLTMMVGAGGNAGNQASVRGTFPNLFSLLVVVLDSLGWEGHALIWFLTYTIALISFFYSNSRVGIRDTQRPDTESILDT
jgi:hypothetical protein